MYRDPRINPRKGDKLRQPSGLIIEVTGIDGDAVKWNRLNKSGNPVESNGWNLRGWQNVVAKDAIIIYAETLTPEPHE